MPDVLPLHPQLQQDYCEGMVQLNKVYKKSSLRFSSNSSKLVVRDESDTELGLGLVNSGNQQSTNASAVS